MTAGVYRIHCKANDTYYIGETTDFERRIRIEHIRNLRSGKHHNRHLQNAWNFYGESAFSVEIVVSVPFELTEVATREEISIFVKRLEAQVAFSMLDCGMKLFNMRDFCHWGEASPMLTPLIREKAIQSLRRPEARKSQSETIKKARRDPILGPKITAACQSEEARTRRSISMKNAWAKGLFDSSTANKSEEYREKLTEAAKKMWMDENFRSRMSIAHSGERNPKSRKVKRIDTGEIFPSLGLAAKASGTTSSNIHRAIQRKIKTAGTHWDYSD